MRTSLILFLSFCFIVSINIVQAQVISSGDQHSLVICQDGTVWTCGANNSGQLGNDTIEDYVISADSTWSIPSNPVPMQIQSLSDIVKVSGGYGYSMALRNDGTVWGWGGNWNGQIGIVDTTSWAISSPRQIIGLDNIIEISASSELRNIAAMYAHSLALRNDGTVWAWGDNSRGQLGDSTTMGVWRVLPMPILGLSDIISVSAGRGYSLALQNDGSVWKWGNGIYTPTKMSGISNITAISAGYRHSLVLRSDGTVWAWGDNRFGQLGIDTTGGNQHITTPIQVPNLYNITNIVTGYWFSLALKDDGTVWAWGENFSGQLGNDTTSEWNLNPVPSKVHNISNIIEIAAGEDHAMALQSDGTVLAWGGNWYGQIGDGTTTNRTTPVRMYIPCSAGECKDNRVNGTVFNDLDTDCVIDSIDYGMSGWIVKAEPGPSYGFTDYSGDYQICLDSGKYTVSLIDKDNYRYQICPSTPAYYDLVLDTNDTIINDINFSVITTVFCPDLSVDIATSRLRACTHANYYVTYCNNGTIASNDVYIEVTFDTVVTPVSSTLSWSSKNGNTYKFNIGTVSPSQCNIFSITTTVSCYAVMGSTHCIEASIYPDTICSSIDKSWDKSSIEVKGYCSNDSSACFTIYNKGNGDMDGNSEYRIYENNVLVSTNTFQLLSEDNTQICWTTNSNTIRLEADQHPKHPGKSYPRAHVELCGNAPPFKLGQVMLVPEDDRDADIEIDCKEIIASYDPNDKIVKPVGITSNKHVSSNAMLEYQINFQNTGTDTAFKVVIVDILSENLDITSIKPGVCSHEYTFEILGSNVLRWTFDNILLPDSNINEPESHGFLKYKVNQVNNSSKGTLIENKGAIYFDINNPVITNTVWNIVFDTTTTAISEPVIYRNGVEIAVFPNPFNESTTFTLSSTNPTGAYSFVLRDVLGREVKVIEGIATASFQLSKGNLPAGIYFYQIESKEQLIGSGKLVVE